MKRCIGKILLASIFVMILIAFSAANCRRSLNATIALISGPTVECNIEACLCNVTVAFRTNTYWENFNLELNLQNYKVTNRKIALQEDNEDTGEIEYLLSFTVEPGTYNFYFSGETLSGSTSEVKFTVICDCQGCHAEAPEIRLNPTVPPTPTQNNTEVKFNILSNQGLSHLFFYNNNQLLETVETPIAKSVSPAPEGGNCYEYEEKTDLPQEGPNQFSVKGRNGNGDSNTVGTEPLAIEFEGDPPATLNCGISGNCEVVIRIKTSHYCHLVVTPAFPYLKEEPEPFVQILTFTVPEGQHTITVHGVDMLYSSSNELTFSVSCICEGCRLTLSSNPPEGGTTTGAGDYEENGQVTVMAFPNTNWEFIEWTGEFTSANAQFSFQMPDHDVHLTANFEPSTATPPAIQLHPTKEPTPTADGEQTLFYLYASQPLTELRIGCNTFLRTIQNPEIKETVQNPDSSTTYLYEETHRRVEGNNAYEIAGTNINGNSNTLLYNVNRSVLPGFRSLGKKGGQYNIIALANNSKAAYEISFLALGTVPFEHRKIVEMDKQYQFVENASRFVGNYSGLAEYCMGSYWIQSAAYIQLINNEWVPTQKIDNVTETQSVPGHIAFYESDAVQLAKNTVYGAHLSRHPYENGVSFAPLSGNIAGIVPYGYDPLSDSHSICFLDLSSPFQTAFIGSNGIATGIQIPAPGSTIMREDPVPLFGIPVEYGTPTYIGLYKKTDETTQFIINFVKPDGSYWVKIFTDTGHLCYSFQTHTELSQSVVERDEDYFYQTIVKTAPDEETQGAPLTYGNLYVLHTSAPGFEVWEPLDP
jgi:hypothetical protein